MKLTFNVTDVLLLTGFGPDKLVITTDLPAFIYGNQNLHFTIEVAEGSGNRVAKELGLKIKATIGRGKTISFIDEHVINAHELMPFTKEFMCEPAPRYEKTQIKEEVKLPNPHNGVYRYTRRNRISGKTDSHTISEEHMERQYPGMPIEQVINKWNSYDPAEWVYRLDN